MSTAVQPHRLFNFERHQQWLLCCPQCGHQWTHLQRAFALEGSCPFEGAAECGELFGVPVGGVSEYRRGALVIEFWCEGGHRFSIEIEQHRGQSFITPRMVEE